MRLDLVWVMSLWALLENGEIRAEEEYASDHQYATSGKEPSSCRRPERVKENSRDTNDGEAQANALSRP
jgi:hypothetical protein